MGSRELLDTVKYITQLYMEYKGCEDCLCNECENKMEEIIEELRGYIKCD